MTEQHKYPAVESIRGIACFMVVLSHLSLTFFPFLHAFDGKANQVINPIQSFIHESPLGFFYSGTSAVYIFFVLSGFILTKVALKGSDVPTKVFSMIIQRYPRLMFPVLVSCVIAFVAFQMFSMSSPFLTNWINHYGDFPSSLTGAIYSGGIEVFFLSGKSPYNPVLWTMKIELIGSFIVYVLCINRATSKIPYLAGVSLVLVSIFIVFKVIGDGLGLEIYSFLGGYAFCIYGKRISFPISIILLIFGLYFAGVHNESWSYSLMHNLLRDHAYKLCNFMSGFLIVYAIIFNERLNLLFSGKTITFMGKVSFSVYLIHLPIIYVIGIFLFNVLHQYFAIYSIAAITSSILSIVSIYFASLFFYKAIDYSGIKISDSLAKAIISNVLTIKQSITADKPLNAGVK